MANLKDLKIRISSVKSTRKITKAMQMVAAAKLKRAQDRAEAARPYAERMDRMIGTLAASYDRTDENAPRLLVGTGKDLTHLFVVLTAQRGLCGGFNSTIVREAKNRIRALRNSKRRVKILCIGKKGKEQLSREFADLLIDVPERLRDIGKQAVSYDDARAIADHVLALFDAGEFDVCTMFYSRFKSAISQIVTGQQLIPLGEPEEGAVKSAGDMVYDYEPEEGEILSRLLPENLGTQLLRALLENGASEQGARMTAMDNATRNAGDMINRLTLQYNRTRQAAITKELIEIISGAEAL
ncbi:MAG: F0F1 ATP synthase subunit gamma [Alphaproteobacteria bacterium]|nr:F0F1 ATP synthase subunit gamma [Alphaproteobacteria bacterium]